MCVTVDIVKDKTEIGNQLYNSKIGNQLYIKGYLMALLYTGFTKLSCKSSGVDKSKRSKFQAVLS